jgi:KEOPS complex subunit Cgi121
MTDSCGIRAAVAIIEDRDSFLRCIRAIGEESGTHIICFNADMLAGKRHALLAVRHALRSFTNGTSIANSLEMEALLFASGTRQCTIGASFGIQPGENHLFICCCPIRNEVWEKLDPFCQWPGGDPYESIDQVKKERLMSLFAIPPEEIQMVGEDRFSDLVLERVVLLEAYR